MCFTVFNTGRSSPILVLEPLKTASRTKTYRWTQFALQCCRDWAPIDVQVHLWSFIGSRQCFIYMYERLICLFILCEKILPWCEARPILLMQTVQGIKTCTAPSTRDFATVCKTLIGFVGHIYIYIYSSNAMKLVKVRLFPSKPC